VIDTRRGESSLVRVRQCKEHDHVFVTEEAPYRSEPDPIWPFRSDVQNTRNQGDRILRERVCRGAAFKTIERIRRSED
jgi:hypothetical protein